MKGAGTPDSRAAPRPVLESQCNTEPARQDSWEALSPLEGTCMRRQHPGEKTLEGSLVHLVGAHWESG